MKLSTYDTALRVMVVGAFLLGLASIGFGGRLVTTVGVVLVVLSLVGLIPVVRNFFVKRERQSE